MTKVRNIRTNVSLFATSELRQKVNKSDYSALRD